MEATESKENVEMRPNGQTRRLYLLNLYNASKTLNKDIRLNRLPLADLNGNNVQVACKSTSKSSNGLELALKHPTQVDVNCEKENVLETNVGRSHLLNLIKVLKVNENTKQLSVEGASVNGEIANESPHQPSTDCNTLESASNEPLKLIDLIDDCLERILRELELNDLISVAGCCTRLQNVAQDVFKQQLRKHEVFIDCSAYPRYTINSRGFKYAGKDAGTFLITFGEVITRLTIYNMSSIDNNAPEIDEIIESLITNTCRKHLREIKFLGCGIKTMINAKPFENVIKVVFERSTLGPTISNFEYLFPKMEKLQLIDCNVVAVRESIVKPYPLLKSFILKVPLALNSWIESTFSVAQVKAAIDLNPQIQSLNLLYWNLTCYDAKLLLYAAEHLPHLDHLQLWHLQYTDFCSEGDIHFTAVRKFTLANHFHRLGELERNLSALSFDRLEKLSIIGKFDTECMSFIARHKTITSLSCVTSCEDCWYPTDSDVFRFGSILPNLEKIVVNGNRLTPTGLIRFISKYHSLALIKVCQHSFSAAIRKLFQSQCFELGWKVTFSDADKESQIIIKRIH